MDESMFELELLRQLEALDKPEEPKKAMPSAGKSSPYQNKQQEATGQLINMFSDLDAALEAVFGDGDMDEF